MAFMAHFHAQLLFAGQFASAMTIAFRKSDTPSVSHITQINDTHRLNAKV